MSEITITTKPCTVCGQSTTMVVDREAFDRWRGGELIQNAFPDMDPGERELLITGTHDACWDKLFSEEER